MMLTIEHHGDNLLLIKGDAKFKRPLLEIGAEWDQKSGGWLIPSTKQVEATNLINRLNKKKYHREYSDSDSSGEDDSYKIYRAHAKPPKKFRDELNISSGSDTEEHVDASTGDSDEDYSDSLLSDDGFPSPRTPHPSNYVKETKSLDGLRSEVKELRQRVADMELSIRLKK